MPNCRLFNLTQHVELWCEGCVKALTVKVNFRLLHQFISDSTKRSRFYKINFSQMIQSILNTIQPIRTRLAAKRFSLKRRIFNRLKIKQVFLCPVLHLSRNSASHGSITLKPLHYCFFKLDGLFLFRCPSLCNCVFFCNKLL